MEDRSTFVVVFRSEDAKKMVRDVRKTWKKSEKDRRDVLAKKWNDEPAGAHIIVYSHVWRVVAYMHPQNLP